MSLPLRFLREHKHLIDCVLLILAVVTGYFCYLGSALILDADGASWHSRASAAVFAAGISAMIFLFWRMALSVVPHLPTLRFRVAGMVLIAIGCLAIMGISAWLSVTAQGGASALEQHMNQSVVDFQAATDGIYEQVRMAEQLGPDLDLFAARVTGLGRDEYKSGRITGRGGAGGVESTLQTVGEQASKLGRQITQAISKAEALAASAREQLAKMREVANRDEPVARRMVAFAGEAGKLTATLTELSGQNLASSLQRQLSNLPNLVNQGMTSRRDAELAEKQKHALADIRADIEASANVLARAAASIAEKTSIEIPVFKRLSMTQAVFVYAGSLMPLFIGAVSLDIFPSLAVLFVMLVATVHECQGEPRARIDDLTVRQLRDAKAAYKVLQLPPRGPGLGDFGLGNGLDRDEEDLH